MNYSEVTDFLLYQLPVFQRSGKKSYKPGLVNITTLCELLDNPQKRIKTIHIAGTNGKGTVAHLLAAILQESNLKVGLFTSPHYTDFREQIKINGKWISKDFLIGFVTTYKQQISKIAPSFFEVLTAMAFYYFEKEQADVAIIEAGVGGREDATNVIMPILSIITNISYDHQNLLGDSLKEIALAKAGIIKRDTPVVIGETQELVTPIFHQEARRLNAPLFFAAPNFTITPTLTGKALNVFQQQKPVIGNLLLPNRTPTMLKNIVTVLQVVELLRANYKIESLNIKNGVKNFVHLTQFIGRWQVISETPKIVLDSAHNEAGFKNLARSLSVYPSKKLHLLLGFSKGKAWKEMLALLPPDAHYYFTQAPIDRAVNIDEIMIEARALSIDGQAFPNVLIAIETIRRFMEEDELLFITGSSYIVGEVLKKAHWRSAPA